MVPRGPLGLRPSWPPASLEFRSLAGHPAARSLHTSARDHSALRLESRGERRPGPPPRRRTEHDSLMAEVPFASIPRAVGDERTRASLRDAYWRTMRG